MHAELEETVEMSAVGGKSAVYEVNSQLRESSFWPQILACLSAASLHFAVGAVVGFSYIVIPYLESPKSDIRVTEEDMSWLGSVVALMLPAGSMVAGCIIDKIGRLNTIRVAILPYVTGWFCIAVATGVPFLVVGRILTVFSMGLACIPAVVYITEVAKPDHRGALICTSPFLASLAFIYWRTICWISISYCVLPLLLMYWWSPESPVWLVSQGKTELALTSLKFLQRSDSKFQGGVAEQRLSTLLEEHNKATQSDIRRSTFGHLLSHFTKPTGYKPVLLLTVIFTLQGLSGIYIVLYCTATFFKNIGTPINPYICTVGVGVVKVVLGIVTIILLRKFGRRPLFMLSCATMALSIFTCGYYTKQIAEGHVEKYWNPMMCILVFTSAGVVGFMSIPYSMSAELFPVELRGLAQSLLAIIANLVLFVALKIYPFLSEFLGEYGVQWFFAAVSFGSIIFIYIFLPETHRKELPEMQEYFTNNTAFPMEYDTLRKFYGIEEAVTAL
ncbi:facilitated trehalose transporter Tret1-2 homolog isoform X2 [Homalodisca vitripennis]|uniref:facilitated trehalose transporter Tret1-2 homolog isoform X2 n=1 Tax=Homalodisca vitripennis TaxID=197043 RepID=UPI001EEB3C65|nr:facilitated trehalose transporter Tret1-2 homolog isoform X2 [Homalodisca vitripennis]